MFQATCVHMCTHAHTHLKQYPAPQVHRLKLRNLESQSPRYHLYSLTKPSLPGLVVAQGLSQPMIHNVDHKESL